MSVDVFAEWRWKLVELWVESDELRLTIAEWRVGVSGEVSRCTRAGMGRRLIWMGGG